MDRRSFLARCGASAAGGCILPRASALAFMEAALTGASVGRGEVISFEDELRDRRRPRERLYGHGLDGRYRVDLSTLSEDSLVLPNDRFYVRTRAPENLDDREPWQVRIVGEGGKDTHLGVETFREWSAPQGVHLMECSGNGLGGLISAAEWSGAPAMRALDEIELTRGAGRFLIGGVDPPAPAKSRQHEHGCSWVFTRKQLAQTGAFFATEMNGAVLPRDHGRPLRLVVPGWYGCTCVKWISEIRAVGEDEPATAQMREFAGRTLQNGVPALARDYAPAAIDLCAMPIRVEKRTTPDGAVYDVYGVIWGGERTIDRLLIRFGDDGEAVPIHNFEHETNRTWSLWRHTWSPPHSGRYTIDFEIEDPDIRARKLRRGVYRRAIVVER